MTHRNSTTSVNSNRLDSKTRRYIQPILEAFEQAQQQTGRHRFYPYLIAVYGTYQKWKDDGISKKMSRRLLKRIRVPRRKGTTAARILIDATCSALNQKQKSRWSRALEFASMKNVSPNNLLAFLNTNAGIAGCARSAAKRKPKRNTFRNDWVTSGS
jgi:hypothetical protein